jgi:hypothetical protein
MTSKMITGMALATSLAFLMVPAVVAAEPGIPIHSGSSSVCPDEQSSEDEEGWEKLTDGETFDGWKANENEESWKIEDGAFVANGVRSHLFYVGPDHNFKNFELKVDVMTRPSSNGGIYFHTQWQDEGWPEKGYECQVNVSQDDPVKTGSLYNTEKIYKEDIEGIIKDNEWWTQHIIVNGNRVIVKLNDKQVIDYTEPEGKEGDVKLSEGTFALQAHDPKSTVYFKNIRVKRLPDEADGN